MPDAKPTIFVVDDDPILLRGLDVALKGNGYAVRTALNGPELLSLMEEERPDLLLLDVMMPGMDGVEVLRRIRNDDRWSELPVMMITAIADGDVRAEAERRGPTDVIPKPFRLRDLLKTVAERLSPVEDAPTPPARPKPD